MVREYNFNDARYALLTITDSKMVIKMFDWMLFYDNEFTDTETYYNNSSISITTYNPEERDDFWRMHHMLSNVSDVKHIQILSDILLNKKEGLNNECD